MKTILFTILLFALSVIAPAQANAVKQPPQDSIEEELKQIETSRTQAIKAGDVKTLDKIYADDFAGVASGGRAVNKGQLMELFKRVDPRVTFTTDDLKVRLFGETGIVTGRVTGKMQAGEVVSAFSYLHVYVKREGRWQMVAGQSTNTPLEK
ncbi:MAG TPA: nuclear transport factor 2 family protein [Blastocatellia bacterium]|nr:nuclear transport factor 2 family protein [Blastocatellia bacterium]